MFYLTVVLEKSQIIDRGLDPEGGRTCRKA